jgi:murein DD-endopeptidase MepM/ murein hydrolase activator NlpD
MRSIFNLKKIALNLQIYFRVTIVFFRKLPSIIFIFIHDLPKNLKKEGSEIKIHRRRFELARIWPHLGIAILSCVVISSSVFAQDMGYSNSEFSQNLIEPSEYADFAIAADSYIPFIDAKNNDIILALAEADTVVTSDESYILAPADIATEKSPKESTTPSSRTSYITYQILGGETLSFIGVKFNVTSSSILWANPDIKDPNLLKPGTNILIPPRDGMTVIVEKGQSLDNLVKKYSGNFEETLVANNVVDATTIFAGQRILIASGKPAKTPAPQIAKKSTGKVKGTKSSPTGPVGSRGNFIWPTQGNVCNTRHPGYYAIDICAGGASPPIVASDGGVVIEASYGWNSGWGNNVLINHGNGFKTRYAHMRVLSVSVGQSVSQGQQVGIMGTTGNSTGIHLHFEIYIGPVRVNPLLYLP